MRPRVFITAAAGAALMLVSLIATPVAGSSGAAAAAAQAEHDRIVAYWTPARMAAAIPRDLRVAGSPVIPAAKGGIPGPPGGGGGGGGGSDVAGASWTKGGAVLLKTGKVYFSLSGGNWQCSGSVVSDSTSGRSLVLTAGHCAVDETNGSFATNWLFMPDWDASPASWNTACTGTLYGCWTATALVVHYGFAHAGGFNKQATTHDWAFAVVGNGGKSNGQLDTTVGSFGIQFSGVSSGDRLDAFGYPAAAPYSGNDLTYCAGSIFSDQYNGNATWGLGCNMTGGASGGPWLAAFNEGDGSGGTASSLNSYKYSNDKNHMYGPKFNSNTSATYTAAKTASVNTVVGTSP